MYKYLAACLCTTLLTPAAMAYGLDETEIASMDQSDPNFTSLHYFAGDWRCLDNGENGASDNNLTVLHIYGTLKHWYAVETLTFGAHKSESTSYMTYNAHKQAFVEFGLCNHGGYGKGKAPGWENNALVFSGYTHFLDHEGHHWRKTLTKIDDTHFNVLYETSADGQVFSIHNQATCAK